jgi:hypothetical protein
MHTTTTTSTTVITEEVEEESGARSTMTTTGGGGAGSKHPAARSAAAQLLRELPLDRQKAALPELLASCPPGTAGAILGKAVQVDSIKTRVESAPGFSA